MGQFLNSDPNPGKNDHFVWQIERIGIDGDN